MKIKISTLIFVALLAVTVGAGAALAGDDDDDIVKRYKERMEKILVSRNAQRIEPLESGKPVGDNMPNTLVSDGDTVQEFDYRRADLHLGEVKLYDRDGNLKLVISSIGADGRPDRYGRIQRIDNYGYGDSAEGLPLTIMRDIYTKGVPGLKVGSFSLYDKYGNIKIDAKCLDAAGIPDRLGRVQSTAVYGSDETLGLDILTIHDVDYKGVKIGKISWYDKNGTLTGVENFLDANGIPDRYGRVQSIVSYISEEGDADAYKNSAKIGKVELYDKYGTLKVAENYLDQNGVPDRLGRVQSVLVYGQNLEDNEALQRIGLNEKIAVQKNDKNKNFITVGEMAPKRNMEEDLILKGPQK